MRLIIKIAPREKMLELPLFTAPAVQVIVRSISACTTDFLLAGVRPVIKIALRGSRDNTVVRGVAQRLPQDGLNVWFDENHQANQSELIHNAQSLHLP
jgi:hypothetical protein